MSGLLPAVTFAVVDPERLMACYEGRCPFCDRRFEDRDPGLSDAEHRELVIGPDDEPTLPFCGCCRGAFALAKGVACAEVEYEDDWRDGYVPPPCEHAGTVEEAWESALRAPGAPSPWRIAVTNPGSAEA